MIEDKDDKPLILRALEIVLANPKDIREEALKLKDKFRLAHPHKDEDELNKLVANKIILDYP